MLHALSEMHDPNDIPEDDMPIQTPAPRTLSAVPSTGVRPLRAGLAATTAFRRHETPLHNRLRSTGVGAVRGQR